MASMHLAPNAYFIICYNVKYLRRLIGTHKAYETEQLLSMFESEYCANSTQKSANSIFFRVRKLVPQKKLRTYLYNI